MKIKTILTALLATAASSLFAQNNASWLRYPAISPDGASIVFEYKGDLYKVASSGGAALPLSLHEAHDYMPVWSHDGKWIAFASDRYGNFDIFIMPATGGEAKRLTYYSVGEAPYCFSADDKYVIFGAARIDAADNRMYPSGYMPELYKVSVSGGRVQEILTTPAENVQCNRSGSIMLYEDKKGQENPWRKHHVSSVARDIWMYNAASGKHTKLT
ncbi:MAG TPA: peptidase S41, partial [Chitinophagaceae bacterium]|nr:peptidase S41 [Chitinophagaceae bacterium]